MQEKDDTLPFEEDVRHALLEFRVPYPDECLIEKTIDSLQNYVPSKRNRGKAHYKNLKRLLKETAISVNFMSPLYWVITGLLYITGYFAVFLGFDLYHMIFILSPLPVMLGMIEVFRDRNEKMIELELSCKLSPQEIMISKILVTICYNALLNLALSALFCAQSADAGFIKITVLWFVPMLFAGGLTLLLCSRFKGAYALTASISVFIVFAVFFIAPGGAVARELCGNPFVEILLACTGLILFAKEVTACKNRYYFERRSSFGTDD